jgi:hypothetical protein
MTLGRPAGAGSVVRALAGTLRKFEYQPCIPTCGTKVPAGPDRLHEIKHDGYRLTSSVKASACGC